MPGGRLLRGAAAASMISSARTNRAVRKNIEAQNNDATQNQAAPQDDATTDPAAEIKKYKGMMDDGLITQEEFDAKKKQILGI